MLFGSYRKGDANDPKTYTAAIAAVLADYPDEVIRSVTDPRTGIAGRLKFMPNPAEVRDTCEALMETERRTQERERRLAETERLLAESRAREARGGPRESYEQLKARLGERFGMSGPGAPLPPADPRGRLLDRANRRVLEKAGTDMSTALPVSPMLAELVRTQTGRAP